MSAMLARLLTTLLSLLRRTELPLLLGFGFVAAMLMVFAGLADEMLEGDTHDLDRALLLSLRNPADLSDPLGPGWFEEMVRDFTAFGSTGPLVFIALAAFCYLLLLKKYRTAVLLFVAVGGGQMISSLLKIGFDRPRPDLVPHGMSVYTGSFPSGHAMMAAVTYLTLAALLSRTAEHRRQQLFLLLAAILLTILVGFSRVYLGVHWPSDVLGGWIAGSAWAALCWSIALLLQRRGEIEKPGETAA